MLKVRTQISSRWRFCPIYALYYIKKIIQNYCDSEKIDRRLETLIVKYYELFPKKVMGIRERKAKRPIIISLTTIPRRIDKVWITVESLLRQTYKPDKIILWLAKDEFADIELPEKLRRQTERGLSIRYCDNLRSYKKFYYTAVENPHAYVVTVDDDMIYAENLLENMVKAYRKSPRCIICTRSHMVRRVSGKILPYQNWINYEQRGHILKETTYQNFFVGCGGVFFPMFLMDKRLFEKDIFMDIAPTADDVWLNFIAWVSGLKTKNIDGVWGNLILIKSSSDSGLCNINRKKNDEQIKQIMDYLQIAVDEYV